MINLIPYDKKRQIRAARANIILIKCIAFMFFAVLFLAIACSATYMYLKNAKDNAEKQASTSNIAKNDASSSVLSEASIINTDLITANNIINQQIIYSNIITEIAKNLPAGVVLDSLTLNNSSIGTPISLTLYATTANKGQEIKDNFNKITLFSGLNIKSVNPVSSGPSGYPFVIDLTLIINKATK